MKKLLFYSLFFVGCTTQKKATSWLNDHPTAAAKFCADKFPVTSSTDSTYRIDSADYERAYAEVWAYADSLLTLVQSKKSDTVIINGVQYITRYVTQNIDSLRKAITAQLKKSLRPCIDSVKTIIKTVENTARVKYLEGINEKNIETITARDARITKLQGLRKWVWFFWILVLVIILYLTRRIWGAKIPFIK